MHCVVTRPSSGKCRVLVNCRAGKLFSIVALLMACCSPASWSQRSDPAPSTRQLDVQWPNVNEGKSNLESIQRKQQAQPGIRGLGTADQRKQLNPADLAAVKIPIMLPEKIFEFDSLVFRPGKGGNHYFANAKMPGLTVLIFGSRVVSEPPEQSPSRRSFVAPQTSAYTVSRTENGYRLGMTRYGVPYTISIECEKRTDARCGNDQYIRSLADSMTFVGGQP
jgi:hypothetical protein